MLMAEIMDADDEQSALEAVGQYLAFRSRGVPRLLLQELNALVGWRAGIPRMMIKREEQTRIEFYARLERMLDVFFAEGPDRRLLSVAIDRDRWRLRGYYAVDWILRSEGKPFTAEDIVGAEQASPIDPLLRATVTRIEPILEMLAENEILEVARRPSVDETVIGDVAAVQRTTYNLAEDIRRLLYDFARTSERERAAPSHMAAPSVSAVDPVYTEPELVEVVGGERYGCGSHWSRRDGQCLSRLRSPTGRNVALELLEGTAMRHDPTMRQRFQREAELAPHSSSIPGWWRPTALSKRRTVGSGL